jgi:CubicO group peptidase (beta-lactamase class C family)
MALKRWLFLGLLVAFWAHHGFAQAPQRGAAASDISPLLAEVIERHNVPGMTAAVIEGDRVVATGAAGLRKRGGREKVTVADKFHIGSCTKTMTATLCAMLVEEGKLKWDTTIAAAFPDARSLHRDYRTVTLEQLLTHRGGAPDSEHVDPAVRNSLWEPKGVAARRKVLDAVFSQPPQVKPGTEFVFSNYGYALAGHMAERAARKPWDDLLREKLFNPLGMTSAGFGAPLDRGTVRQPRGHSAAGEPFEPTRTGADNPPAIGPAGTVHCSVGDWAKFIAVHLRGARGDAKLLKLETYRKLHAAPEGGDYAMGWIACPSPFGDGKALNHAGSNTLWYAIVWALPEQNAAVLVMCNQAEPGGKACQEASEMLIRQHLAARGAK